MSARDLQKMAVKLFAEPAPGLNLQDLIPVFHRWIREHVVEGVLVDVADYSHLPQSPGVVLVSHEADYALDAAEGPLGLLYVRKAPQPGELRARIAATLKAAREACAKLEAEPALGGRLRFRKAEGLFIANDRLLAPNDGATWEALRSDLEAAAREVLGPVILARDAADPRRRLTAAVKPA